MISACAPAPDSATEGQFVEQWPSDLVTPIEGATFPLAENHLPGAPREYRAGTHQGFDFFNGLSGRPLADDEPVVAVADGEIIRIDRDYDPPAQARQAYYSQMANDPGFVGEFALDQLRGRQVWIRHEQGHVSRYAHLSEVHPELQPGDGVEQGQVIGLMGNTGIPATEDQPEPRPHLHFELRSADGNHYLGQDLTPIESHRMVATVFSEQALPRYARRVVASIETGEAAPEQYPPDPLPETGFHAEPPESAVKGQAFAAAITWENDDFTPSDIFGNLQGQPLGVIDAGNGAWLLGAIPLGTENEELDLVIGGTDRYGQTMIGARAIEVGDREQIPPAMEIDPELFEQYTEENFQLESQQLGPAMAASLQIHEALWEHPFSAPVNGEVTRQFGQRIFHGLLRPAHPLPGITVVPETGNQVVAANAGRVALVEELPIRGRTVAVVHGGGVVSIYGHLAETFVSPGEEVALGQRLGSAGQSGAADQPQLRWEMYVGGNPSDPLRWLDHLLPGRPVQ